jgi:nucleoside-diphosphate-sugar epimerase
MNAVSPALTFHKSPRLVLTGGTGFVGRHLTDALLKTGAHISLIVLPGTADFCRDRWGASVDIYPHDGTADTLVTALKTAAPDVVIHLAALFVSQHSAADIAPLIQSNLLFGTQLLEAMRSAGVRRLVNTGTSWQHGQHDAPVNLYAATKQAFETLIDYYTDTEHFAVTTLKLFDTYGPHDPRPKLTTLLRQSQSAAQPIAFSGGEQILDLLYIDDVVSAFMHAAQLTHTGHQRYGLPSLERLTLRALVARLDALTGTPCRIDWGARPYRAREVMQPWSGQPALPGWTPRISLDEGLRRTFLGTAT